MTRRRIVPITFLCCLITLIATHALSQTSASRSGLKREQRLKEYREKAAKRKEDWDKKNEEAGGFIHEKYALGVTEEQWRYIQVKLEKINLLREQARSTIGVRMASSSGSETNAKRIIQTWQWDKPWKDMDPDELTEAQRLAQQLIALVEKNNTTPEQFRRKVDALRKARKEEDQIKMKLADAQKELRKLLTTRQEATLVLMKWL